MPPGRLKLTEQGETIAFKYGLPGLAYRNLEAALAATLLAAVPERTDVAAPEGAEAIVAELSDRSRAEYRALVDDAGFGAFFRAFTPVDELALLNIGSRPVAPAGRRRRAARLAARDPVGVRVDAEPLPLPAWYGCGSAFAAADAGELRRLYRDWGFFRSLVQNLEMTLAKSSIGIAREYLDLVEDDRLWATDRGRARAHGRGGARDRRGGRAARPAPGRAALGAAAEPVRRPDERDPGRAAAPLPGRRRELPCQPLLRSIAGIAAALRNTG